MGESQGMPSDESERAESDLVQRAREGDMSVWSRWYDEYYPLLYRYALVRLGNREDAEDVAAQAFLSAFKAFPRFRYRGRPVLAWLYSITHNAVAERLRRRQRAARAEATLRSEEAVDPGPEELLSLFELRQALTHLTADQREVILLRFFFSLSLRDAAAAMGKKEPAVAALQVRAIAALRRHLEIESLGGVTEPRSAPEPKPG